MAGTKKVDSDPGFLTAAWEMAGMITSDGVHKIGIALTPTHRKGVFQINISVYEIEGQGRPRRVARYSCEYPNASSVGLAACIMQGMYKVDGLVAEAVLEGSDERFEPATK